MSLAPRVSNASRNVFLFYSFSAVTFATQSPRKRTFSCGCALTSTRPKTTQRQLAVRAHETRCSDHEEI